MGLVELFILAVGLSMDAFAVSICKGLAGGKVGAREMGLAGVWFGGFQALMPVLGYILGAAFADYITAFDHWIAFLLLVAIGANMIREAFSDECEKVDNSFALKTMFVMAVATSIDALAVGITFGLLLDSWKEIILASLFICSITFCFSAAGVKIGSVFGNKYEKKAEIAGGIILILIGIKILLNHLGIL